ncbi:pseudouridine synthase [Zopfochytrium polystomum]|nr:pseudouridine synthase [Zopfochytrium polystomum]
MTTTTTTTTASVQPTTRIAILFGYNGDGYNGLERSKGGKTIENELLTALATLAGQSATGEQITLLNISRASSTEEGEHAARQVISLEMVGNNVKIPSPSAMNAILPETIRVFKIVRPAESFSARRSCEIRTYEYVIPTYVFAPPPPETGYRNEYQPEMSREVLDSLYPDPNPTEDGSGTGNLFTTLKRGLSRTNSRHGQGSLPRPHADELPAYAQEVSPPPSPRHASGQGQAQGAEFGTSPNAGAGGNAITRFFDQFRGRSSGSKSLSRKKSGGGSSGVLASDSVESVNAGASSGQSRSRSRPRSRQRSRDLRRKSNGDFADDVEYTAEEADNGPQYFDPVRLTPQTPASLATLRSYRMTPEQVESLRNIIAIYRGTHNWHNFIPGAEYEDGRCYIRVMDMQMSNPEIRPAGEPAAGMEFVRIKIRAKAFARFQFRKMVALAIMVIRTNTPRSLVAGSFGVGKFEVPECPSTGMIFELPSYDDYNDAPTRPASEKITFDDEKDVVERFRKSYVHDRIYRDEEEHMHFNEWLRRIDSYAFLYTHFLNSRGVLKRQTNFLRMPGEGDPFYAY